MDSLVRDADDAPTISPRLRRTLALAATALSVAIVGGAAQNATALPAGFVDTLVASVESPTALAFTPDGCLLVTTQFGALRVVEDGTLLPEPAWYAFTTEPRRRGDPAGDADASSDRRAWRHC